MAIKRLDAERRLYFVPGRIIADWFQPVLIATSLDLSVQVRVKLYERAEIESRESLKITLSVAGQSISNVQRERKERIQRVRSKRSNYAV